MSDLDQAISRALAADTALGPDPSLPRQLLDTFRGQFAVLNAIVWIVGFIAAGIGAYCAWRFATATDVLVMGRWGAAAALAIATLIMLKIWMWMELQRNIIVRELKRLELQVARFAEKV